MLYNTLGYLRFGLGWDLAVAGAGITGLILAREASRLGLSVKLVEEHGEIGIPEVCDGVVSTRALLELSIVPRSEALLNRINRAVLHSPSGYVVELDARGKGVLVLSRRALDRELAESLDGVNIELSSRAEFSGGMVVKGRRVKANHVVDARGISALKGRKGMLQACKYELKCGGFEEGTIELYFDQTKTLGYFLWVIPIGPNIVRVGAAGKGIDPFKALHSFLKEREYVLLKRACSSIYVGGYMKRFLLDDRILVGDAAGMTKPTTGGGIYTGGVGAMFLAKAVKEGDLGLYEKEWKKRFSREFGSMIMLRRVFERLGNRQIDLLFEELSDSLPSFADKTDFDFHSSTILKAMLGSRAIELVAKVIGVGVIERLKSHLGLN